MSVALWEWTDFDGESSFVPKPLTVGHRLHALRRDLGFRSVLAFQQALDPKYRGTSYASVWSYFNDKAEPSADFLVAVERLAGRPL